MKWYSHKASWYFILGKYLPRLAFCSLVWELVQLPLYTLWSEPHLGRISFAIAHCTLGDVMIGTAALLIALLLNRAGEFTGWPKGRIALLLVLLSVSYTIFSERLNLAQGNWSYASWMPMLPWIDVGMAPVIQWIIVPYFTWRWANNR